MNDISSAFGQAVGLIATADSDLLEIVALSLRVSLSAVMASLVLGIPLGAMLAIARFPGRGALTALVSALMGLPPVVAGLVVYLMLSRAGPFGVLGLLYSPTAMIIAQTLLVTPIIAALTRQTLADLDAEYDEHLRSLGVGTRRRAATLIWDARFSLLTAILAGFGRAIAEVGAILIVGGNIDHVTRTMTTAIALETSKGDLARALALGLVLLAIALAANVAVHTVGERARRSAYT